MLASLPPTSATRPLEVSRYAHVAEDELHHAAAAIAASAGIASAPNPHGTRELLGTQRAVR